MNNKTLLIAALVLGVIGAVLNWTYLSGVEGASLTVMKARETIKAGTPVTDDLFEPVTIHGDISKMASIAIPQNDFSAYRNQAVTETLEKGQLLLLRSFRVSGDTAIRDTLVKGQRALSISVQDEAQAVGYSVRPGTSVDVWGWVYGRATLLKPEACVVAAGDPAAGAGNAEGNEGRYRSVTIIVSEADVEPLISNLELANGRVTLSLVGPCDPNAASKPAHTVIRPLPNPSKPESAADLLSPPETQAPHR